MRTWLWILLLCALGWLWAPDCPAQTQPATTVQAFGEQSIDVAPEKVRLMLVAKAEGASAKEAVERLTQHKAAVRAELLAMKAEADSIKITSGEMRHHLLGVPSQYQNMNAKFFSNILEGSLNLSIEDLPTVHTASCVIEADWLLTTADADLILQLPNSLREEVEKRDLVGNDNGLELSPEQAANIAKFKAAMDEHMGFYDESDSQPEQVQVLFVASLKTEAKAAALTGAFEKAKEECGLLAIASGHKLGRLVSLTKAAPDDVPNHSFGSAFESQSGLGARLARTPPRNEVSSRQADGLQARFQVRAVFEVE